MTFYLFKKCVHVLLVPGTKLREDHASFPGPFLSLVQGGSFWNLFFYPHSPYPPMGHHSKKSDVFSSVSILIKDIVGLVCKFLFKQFFINGFMPYIFCFCFHSQNLGSMYIAVCHGSSLLPGPPNGSLGPAPPFYLPTLQGRTPGCLQLPLHMWCPKEHPLLSGLNQHRSFSGIGTQGWVC